MSLFDRNWFGSKAEEVRLHDARTEVERRKTEAAKDVILPKLELATVDGDGKRLNERQWRRLYRTVERI